jgi:hypothetical protein
LFGGGRGVLRESILQGQQAHYQGYKIFHKWSFQLS